MKKRIALAAAFAASLVLSSAYAGHGGKHAESGKDKFKLIHVQDLVSAMNANSDKVFIYDANSSETRTRDGIIPGAKMLSSIDKFDTKTELPSDKTAKLVFYCANSKCMASHTAAKRAASVGFKDVNVMSDGIQGWKSSGMQTLKP